MTSIHMAAPFPWYSSAPAPGPSSSDRLTFQSQRPLSYPCQTSIIRWLPIIRRIALTRRAPSIRLRERQLPFAFKTVDFRSARRPSRFLGLGIDPVPKYALTFDGLRFEIRELCIAYWEQANPNTVKTRLQVSVGLRVMVQGDTALPAVALIHRLLYFFFGRPGSVVMNMLADEKLLAICRQTKMFPLRVARSATWITITPPTLDTISAAFLMESPFLMIEKPYCIRTFGRILEVVEATGRRVGSSIYTFCYVVSELHSILPQLLSQLQASNPKRGVMTNRPTLQGLIKKDTVRASTVQCVFFEMEHAVLSVCLPDFVYKPSGKRQPLPQSVKMEVLAKGSIVECRREEEWRSTFRLSNGSFVSVNVVSE